MNSSAALIRPLETRDLDRAHQIMEMAFGTFLGLREPLGFLGDASFIHGRFHADPTAAFAAERDERLVGSNFATGWGSVGFFGPLTVEPDCWGRGIAQQLMEPVLDCFERWGTAHAGLFTFSHSPQHLSLYQKFGFWPRCLRLIMSREVGRGGAPANRKLSELPEPEQHGVIEDCASLTDSIHAGLDVRREMHSLLSQGFGDTLLVDGEHGLEAFAVCHHGAGSETGTGRAYLKFAAARDGDALQRLLEACEASAAAHRAHRLVLGVSAARGRAYRQLLQSGFRIDQSGVSMHRPNDCAYDRDEVFILDDWR